VRRAFGREYLRLIPLIWSPNGDHRPFQFFSGDVKNRLDDPSLYVLSPGRPKTDYSLRTSLSTRLLGGSLAWGSTFCDCGNYAAIA
jgi:hypothetical protein